MPTKPPTHQVKRARRPEVRLSPYRRGYGGAWQKIRRQVIARDAAVCQSCGHVCGKPKEIQVDHIKAKRHGGTDDMSNLQVLCAGCHGHKTRQEVAEHG